MDDTKNTGRPVCVQRTGRRILIVEDDAIISASFERILSALGYDVIGIIAFGEEVLQKVVESPPDLVLMDIYLAGDMNGIEAAAQIQAQFDIPVVYLTAYSNDALLQKARNTEPYGYLVKPVRERDLHATIKMALYRHKLEDALRESEELHRITLSNISDAVFITDDSGAFTYICPNVDIIFGYSEEEVSAFGNIEKLLGGSLFDINQLDISGEIPNIEHEIVDKAGKGHTLLVNVKSVSIKGGTLLYTCRDVTERKQAEEELREYRDHLEQLVEGRTVELTRANEQLQREILERKQAEEKLLLLSSAVEQSTEGIGIVDMEGNILFVNNAIAAMYGYTSEELVGEHISITYPSNQRSLVNESIRQIKEKGDFSGEMLALHRDGSVFPTLMRNSLLHDETGNPIGMIATIRDITERKRTEREKYRNLVETSQNLIWQGNSEGRFTYLNPAWESVIGYKVDEMIGRHFTEFKPPEEREKDAKIRKNILEGSEIFGYETIYISKSGEQKNLVFNARTLKDADGNTIGTQGTAYDITARKRAEDELNRYREHLEELVVERTAELENTNKELKDFAYIVSHDLKAPLRGISQLADWISQDYTNAFDEDGKEMMNLLIGRAKRMDNLIEGVLQYSRVGRIVEGYVNINLNTLVKNTIELIEPPEHIQITIENELPVIAGDRTRIEQVFQNLLGDAIKFMDKPRGEVKVACVDEGAHWKFSVTDNGPGIKEKHHETVFQIFQTLTSRDERESTGVGLTIVKKIIELHGGRIWVESEVGEGSTFFFTLPKKGEKNEE